MLLVMHVASLVLSTLILLTFSCFISTTSFQPYSFNYYIRFLGLFIYLKLFFSNKYSSALFPPTNPGCTQTRFFSIPLVPVESPQVGFLNHHKYAVLYFDQGSTTSLCSSLGLQIPCTSFPIGGAFGIQPSVSGGSFLQK